MFTNALTICPYLLLLSVRVAVLAPAKWPVWAALYLLISESAKLPFICCNQSVAVTCMTIACWCSVSSTK